jgi:hypothetical protein
MARDAASKGLRETDRHKSREKSPVAIIRTYDNVGLSDVYFLLEPDMSAIDYPALYDDLLDLLADSADAKRVLAFRLSEEKQTRLDELLDKNRDGTLTVEESSELDAYEQFEHLVRLLKARLLQKQGA